MRWLLIGLSPNLAATVFVINQIGVLIAGFIVYRMILSSSKKLFWITGFAGGFTTMSSLAFVIQEFMLVQGIFYAAGSFLISTLILWIIKQKVHP